jgi:hypothetical protein
MPKGISKREMKNSGILWSATSLRRAQSNRPLVIAMECNESLVAKYGAASPITVYEKNGDINTGFPGQARE